MAIDQVAPAQPDPTPVPDTAVDQAVIAGDVSSFREAKRAERTGKPLPVPDPVTPPVPAADPDESETPPPAATAAPERTVSKRQQQINEYERRIAEQDQRIRALEARQAPPAPRSPEPPTPAEPEYKRYLALPDAPKLESFESVDEHAAAMALFIADKRYEERDALAQRQSLTHKFVTEQQERNRTFNARVNEAIKTDPAFWDRVSPDVKALRPRADLRPDEQPSAANDLADEILDHEHGPRLMVHLTDHPDVLQRLTQVPSRAALYKELGKLYATFEQPAQTPPPQHISSAPEPVTTLGKKAAEPANEVEAAVASGDVAAFRAKRMQERAALQRR